MWARISTITAIIVLAGCAEPMESVSYISKLRIMAIQANPPEIRPGEGTTLQALWADPDGEGREVQFAWLTLNIEVAPSSSITEDANPEDIFLWFGFGSSMDNGDIYTIPSVPDDILDDLPEEQPYLNATTIMLMCAGGTLTDPTSLDELPDLTNIEELCIGGDPLVAFKNIRISTADDDNRNANPELTDVYFDGELISELGDDEDDTAPPAGIFECTTTAACLEGAKLEAEMTEESFQAYDKIEFGETVTGDDAPYISWFATGGELGKTHSRTVEPPGPFKNNWSPPLDGGSFTLWVVAHDLRGGTSWKRYAIAAKTHLDH